MNRHERRKRAAQGLPSAESKLKARDPLVQLGANDEHWARLQVFEKQLLGLLGGFSWVDGMVVCLRLAACFAIASDREVQKPDEPLRGIGEDVFAENARRNYRQLAESGPRAGSPEAS